MKLAQVHNPGPTSRKKRIEPLAEGLIPLKRKLTDWASMTDQKLIGYAKKVIEDKGIQGRGELFTVDRALYNILSRRGLFDLVGLAIARRNYRDWAKTGDIELVGIARKYIADNGITCRKELQDCGKGLYNVLLKRDLLDLVGLEKIRRDLAKLDDNALVEFAKEAIAEGGIRSRTGLARADGSLFQALWKRNLLEKIGLGMKLRVWTDVEDKELVLTARKLIEERGISGRGGLQKADVGLYKALYKKGLLDDIGLDDKRGEKMDWSSMGREGILRFAREFIAEKGIEGRFELEKTDRRLYRILTARKLLDVVFSGTDKQKHRDAILGVIEAVEGFGGPQ